MGIIDEDDDVVTEEKPPKPPKPPKDLSPEAKEWWQEICDAYSFSEGRLKLLDLAAHALTRAGNARATLKRDGPFYRDKHAVMRPHPATLVLRNAESAFAQLFKALKLDEVDKETEKASQPYIDKRSLGYKMRNQPWMKK